MSEQERRQTEASSENITPDQARNLLASVPQRPRRTFSSTDHVVAAVVIVLSLASGLLASTGSPWWAIIPGLAALSLGSWRLSHRRERANEPRFPALMLLLSASFPTFLVLPIWWGIRHDQTAEFPEAFLLGGLSAAVALLIYLVLLIRR